MPMRRTKRGSLTHIEHMAYEVQWYEKHGQYPERIKLDDLGHRYVQSDYWWNRLNHYRQESIRSQLADYLAFKQTGIKA